MQQGQQSALGGADPLDGEQLGQHLALAAQVVLLVRWGQLDVFDHRRREALQVEGLEHRVLRGDHISGAPQAQGDALAFAVPGGCAHVALMQPPAHSLGKHVLGMQHQLQRSFAQGGVHGVDGRWGGWRSSGKGSDRGIRRQQAMGRVETRLSMQHSR